MIEAHDLDEEALLATPIGFAELALGMQLYEWQDRGLTWFEAAPMRRVKGSISTPNGGGKSERIVATLFLWWLFVHPQGKVVVTSKSALQLETQVAPAINKHRAKFDKWRFVEGRVTTPTGGLGIMFVTDEFYRAEGHHPVGDIKDGPLLIIVDEAKSVPEEVFMALDRCSYQALLYVSSPGFHRGRFYESQFFMQGFERLRIGLLDCPHISQEKIDDLMAIYGPDGSSPNPQFLKSTLHGEFMDASAEGRFNLDGLTKLKAAADAFDANWRAMARARPSASLIGELFEQPGRGIQWLPDLEEGWLWMCEPPIYGCDYIGFADPMTGEQSEGSAKRDTHAFGIIRCAYIDGQGVLHPDEVVAALYGKGDGARWDNDIAAERFDILLRFYGDCIAIVEENNAGVEVLRLLKIEGRNLWMREKRSSRGGKKLEIMGFNTSSKSKALWIGAIGRAIREEEIVCNFPLAVEHMQNFILGEDGEGKAQEGTFDDWVAGIGLGLFAKASATRMVAPVPTMLPQQITRGAWS